VVLDTIRTGFVKPRAVRGSVCALETYQWCGEFSFAYISASKYKCFLSGNVDIILNQYLLSQGLDDRGPRVRFPAGAVNFSLYHRVQSGSETNPASYPMDTEDSFPGGRAAGA
jgi:hypothetical protein